MQYQMVDENNLIVKFDGNDQIPFPWIKNIRSNFPQLLRSIFLVPQIRDNYGHFLTQHNAEINFTVCKETEDELSVLVQFFNEKAKEQNETVYSDTKGYMFSFDNLDNLTVFVKEFGTNVPVFKTEEGKFFILYIWKADVNMFDFTDDYEELDNVRLAYYEEHYEPLFCSERLVEF